MVELFLKFIDENGDEQEIPVEQEEFIVGRHSENDLSIVNSKLSREHVKIQRYADIFIISDLDSSNGTTLNGKDLDEPIALKNEDIINLGGGLEVEVKLISDDPNAQNNPAGAGSDDDSEKSSVASAGAGSAGSGSSTSVSSQQVSPSGIGKALILAPILGFIFILSVVGAIFLIGGESKPERAKNNDDDVFIKSSIPEDDTDDESSTSAKTPENITETPQQTDQTPSDTPSQTLESTDSSTSTETTDSPPITPPESEVTDETKRVRNNSFKFMRSISRNNEKAILYKNQLAILENKVNQFKNSGALASNIKNAQSNATEIQTLARSKNLKPLFLATAALAKLGNSSGNVLAQAREMAEVLDNLNIQLGDEKADDSLIMMAAYDQGVRGKFLDMRNTLVRLEKDNPTRASEIRTIWYLKEKNKISDAQFDLALRFLAIGTITQNPKAFNVNAEVLTLN
jgi:hypothetical protein